MNVLVISCGDGKRPCAAPALDLYTGRQFALARRLRAKGWRVLVLSGQFGLVKAETVLPPYDRKMHPRDIGDLTARALPMFLEATRDATRVLFYGGEAYFHVWWELVDRAGLARASRGCDCTHITGGGCGDHYSVLTEIVREEAA